MAPRLLSLLLVLLVALALTAKVREALDSARADRAEDLEDPPPRVPGSSPSSGDRRSRLLFELPGTETPLDSLGRAAVRLRLRAETERHYLDSLFGETDSILRHWPVGVGTDIIPLAIIPADAEPHRELAAEVRSALAEWNPGAVGLRFREQDDTVSAALLVRWTDSLEADRAGVTDVTWDKAGRIRRVTVYLATRSPATGRPFSPESRRAIVLHELGHALGLPHSTASGDAMYPVASTNAPSDRDRFSLRLLYELPSGWIGTANRERLP